jgi:hypothetical protein
MEEGSASVIRLGLKVFSGALVPEGEKKLEDKSRKDIGFTMVLTWARSTWRGTREICIISIVLGWSCNQT